ncbi:MAG TPA: aspartate aminotransferase family protein [Tenuifilaceae bacterium]|nr:aspartate aminotransferase family protein [Tenuifilaceae bacterium]HPE19380.1 aspartate aminotransferase family protein [Tenuifilaceae bacterium]HPJ46991.1 aspartate aminotransferase family protein [Tenuifilaceae bacterium]HPQ33252.1 aspartate aminotransferase family protein [Tenuifilaceae bacterium]HRX69259.1 aspartate aminotransferase family protein [Tenuifilaceae bacterium]
MTENKDLFLRFLAQTSDSPLQLEIEKAEGVYLFGAKGKRYIDLISGISVSNVGHSHPRVVDAISQQAARYMHLMVYGEYIQYPQVRLASRMAEILPSNLSNSYFVNSGSEAVEGALKLAKRYTGRSQIVAFKNAYHGGTHGALSVMGNEEQKRAFRPLLPDIHNVEFNDFDEIQSITEKTACVIVEPVQAEAGVRVPKVGFLDALRKRCTEVGALLIFDEIQTGMGRTGEMFAFQKYKVVPDVLLLAKAFGGGMPLGAFISSKDIMSCLTKNPILGHITTFGGHPVSCAASLAAMDILQEEALVQQVQNKEVLFKEKLAKHPAVREFRSSGLIMALELGSFELVEKTIKSCLQQGVITDWFLFCNTAVRIAPPLVISEEEIDLACEAILSALDSL